MGFGELAIGAAKGSADLSGHRMNERRRDLLEPIRSGVRILQLDSVSAQRRVSRFAEPSFRFALDGAHELTDPFPIGGCG